MSLEMKPSEESGWDDYPIRYKFFSVHFQENPDTLSTERTNIDLMDLFSEIGGTLEFLKSIISVIAIKFSHLRLQALLTSRLFFQPYDVMSI